MSKEILIRFINNDCSDVELEQVKRWLDESDEHVNELFQLEQVAMMASGLRDDSESRHRVSRDVRQRIAARRMRLQAHSRKLWLSWWSAAAVVALVVVSAFVWLRTPDVKMFKVVALSESRVVELPDGTTVYLNSGSELRYPETFADVRQVTISGEGFFKVTHDAAHPFEVKGQYLNVRVLGTEFNFKSNDDGENNVSLVEGSVEVSAIDNNKEGVILAPGQKADYDASTGSLSVVETNAAVDAAWHNRIIPFDNATIEDIAEILAQLYNVNIRVDGFAATDKTYSGATVFYADIDSTLMQLSNTLPIAYSINGTTVVIHNQADGI